MKNFVFALALMSVFSCVTAASGDNAAVDDTAKITGRVQVYGSEPRTYVGIVDTHGVEYAVYPPSRGDELRRLQGRLIEFTVVFLDEPQGFGSLFLKGGTVTPIKWEIIR